MITDMRIDGGKPFDWGRTSQDYAKYRDIYPQEFYDTIHSLGLCTKGQQVLDLGTGTGVIPRNMYHYGARFTATDIAENQIKLANDLSQGLDIKYAVASAENMHFPNESFDAVTACQCYFYFTPSVAAKKIADVLKSGGKLAFMYMGWLPAESIIAAESEKLILKYNPDWSGKGDYRHEIYVAEDYLDYFDIERSMIFDVSVPFTRESWNGRIKACRGIGASLSTERIAEFEAEHLELLTKLTEDNFTIPHYCAITVMTKRDTADVAKK
mgnify:CR=1 FL=1